MVNGLDELTAACSQAATPHSESERIALGEPRWFAGHPVPCAPRTVALAQTDSLKLVFRTEDILAVHRWEARFVVRVKPDAHMLVSLENVIKAGPGGSCCGSDKSGTPAGSVARVAVQDPPGDDDWDVLLNKYWGGCLWDIECFTVNVPLLGPIRICIPTHVLC